MSRRPERTPRPRRRSGASPRSGRPFRPHRAPDTFSGLVAQLKARRESLGLTQLELDHVIGLTSGHIAKYEAGIRTPAGMNLFDWANALGLALCLGEIVCRD